MPRSRDGDLPSIMPEVGLLITADFVLRPDGSVTAIKTGFFGIGVTVPRPVAERMGARITRVITEELSTALPIKESQS